MDELIRRDALGRTDYSDVATGSRLANVTPGEVLRIEFMEPLKLSARALAADIDVPANRITEIVNGERAITSDTAVRLGLRLGTSAEFWMNLQASHDLEEARRYGVNVDADWALARRRRHHILRALHIERYATGESGRFDARKARGARQDRIQQSGRVLGGPAAQTGIETYEEDVAARHPGIYLARGVQTAQKQPRTDQ